MKKTNAGRRLIPAFTLAALTMGISEAGTTYAASKQPQAPLEPAKEETWCDRVFGLATLYKGDDADFLNEIAFTGRYHGQFWAADADTGSDEDWENRRARAGLKLLLLQKRLELKGEIAFNLEDTSELYDGFTDLYARFLLDPAFNITVGKQKPKFGWYWSTSSRLILTFERPQLTNQFRQDFTAGVSIDGKVGQWSYYTGVFANDPTEEMADFDGGWSFVASIGYDLNPVLGIDTAKWRLDYIHSEHDSNDGLYNWFDNGVSTSLELKQGQWGLNTELLFGEGQSTALGLMIEPYYDITEKWQAVLRYQLALSDEDNGLRPQSRYERRVGGTNGDTYNAIYGGINYYICEHKLKLMAGVEYANMSGGTGPGYDGWTGFAGVRVYW